MAWVFSASTSTRDVVDPYSEEESTTRSNLNNRWMSTMRRRSWLSHLSISSSIATTPTTTTSHSHRSSSSSSSSSNNSNYSSSSYAYGSTPKPHKANEAAWESMRRLRRQVNKENIGNIGLEHFKLIRRVGSGDLGTVYLCQIRNNNSSNKNQNNNHLYFAMKVVDREALAVRNKLGRAQVEREILCMLDHPFLPTLYADFQASHYSCLVMEFCPGGDLYTARLKQPSKRFSLSSTKFYAAEVLLAIEYLHMMGIIYRDLKPENVLVREDGHIMLSDFDLCLKCDVDVVPKLLIKQEDNNNNNKTTSSSSSNSRPNGGASPSCVGPLLRPVLTSCLFSHSLSIFSTISYSRRKRRSNYSVTTITEQANYSNNNCSSSTTTSAAAATTTTTCSDSSWGGLTTATELVAEPIEARSKSFVGTHEYLAPEVISGQGHGSAVDWWTFGVFLYEMLFGVTPFKGQNNDRTLRNILKQPLTFPTTTTTTTSTITREDQEDIKEIEMAKDLIRRLLVKNPKKRIGSFKGSVEIKKHDFFRGVNWALIRSVKPPVVPAPPSLSSNSHKHNKLPPYYYSNNKINHNNQQYKSTLTCSHRLQQPHTHHFDYF